MEVLSVQNQYQGQFGVIGSSKVKDWTSPLTPPPSSASATTQSEATNNTSSARDNVVTNQRNSNKHNNSNNDIPPAKQRVKAEQQQQQQQQLEQLYAEHAIGGKEDREGGEGEGVDVVDGGNWSAPQKTDYNHYHYYQPDKQQQQHFYYNNHHHYQQYQEHYHQQKPQQHANNYHPYQQQQQQQQQQLQQQQQNKQKDHKKQQQKPIIQKTHQKQSAAMEATYNNNLFYYEPPSTVASAITPTGTPPSPGSCFGSATTDVDIAAVNELAHRVQTELRDAKKRHLDCTEVSLPYDLMPRIAAEIIKASEREPCGVRGCSLYIDFECEPSSGVRRIASFKVDDCTVSTFELYLTLKQDKSGWTSLLPQFLKNLTRSNTILISPDFTLTKNKLYSCD